MRVYWLRSSSITLSFPDPIPGGRGLPQRLHWSSKAGACSAAGGREACKGETEERNSAARNQVLTNLNKVEVEIKLTNPLGMEQSPLHQLDWKDTIQLPRFIFSTILKGLFLWELITLLAPLANSHSYFLTQMTPAKKLVPTPGSSRIVSRVVSSGSFQIHTHFSHSE